MYFHHDLNDFEISNNKVKFNFAKSPAKERKTWSIIIPVRPSSEVVLASCYRLQCVLVSGWLMNVQKLQGLGFEYSR